MPTDPQPAAQTKAAPGVASTGTEEGGSPESPLVMVVDEPLVVRLLEQELQSQGFRVVAAESGAEAVRLAEEAHPLLIVLDTRLPDASGLAVMEEVHRTQNVPVILVSSTADGAEKVRGLDLGADDYVTKPFSPEEVSARVRAVLRRTARPRSGRVIQLNGVEVDFERHVVTREGRPVKLTRTEWMLLDHLVTNAGHVLMNRDLLRKVWGPEYTEDLQYLRVWISRLRRKLELEPSKPRFIKTYAGIGYMLDLKAAQQADAYAGGA